MAALSAQADASGATSPLPVEIFAQRPVYAMPRLSPDGAHFVVRRRTAIRDQDVAMIVVYRTDDFSPISEVRLPFGQTPVGFHWVSNRRLAVSIGKEIGALEAPRATGEIMAMDIDGTSQEYLFGYNMFARSRRGTAYGDDYGFGRVDGISEARDDKIFVAEHKWSDTASSTLLYAIDARKATRKLLARVGQPDARFIVQRNGLPRFAYAWNKDGSLVLLRNEPSTNQWDQVNADDTGVHRPLAFNRDDSRYFALLSKDGGPDMLIRQDMASAHAVTLGSDPVGSIDIIEWGVRAHAPFGYTTQVGIPRLHYVEGAGEEAKLHQALSVQFPDSFVSFESFSDDGGKLLFNVSSDRDPGGYYLLDRKTMRAEFLFASRPWVDAATMAERRPVSFTARDGLMLHGYLTLPRGRPATGLPLVLLPHGGPFGVADTWFWDDDAQFLASRGYAVLQVNFRGSGGRGKHFTVAGHREWGGKIQDDLIDGVRWAVAQGIAGAGRACIVGASFGGYSAVMATIREPAMFRCAVGFVGVYDLPKLMEYEEKTSSKAGIGYMRKTLGSDMDELAKQSPARLAGSVQVPVFLVHGEEDKIAPFDQAVAMRDALKAAGKPFEWMAVPGEGHGFYREKNRAELYRRIEAFLARHLGR